ncbi:MAG: hypothetical protein ACOCRK_02635 [bacterium]
MDKTFKEYKEEVLNKLLASDIKNKGVLFGFYMRMQVIKEQNMVKMLNKLDNLKGNYKDKQTMREMILDNYNDLPRETLKMIEEILTLKE